MAEDQDLAALQDDRDLGSDSPCLEASYLEGSFKGKPRAPLKELGVPDGLIEGRHRVRLETS